MSITNVNDYIKFKTLKYKYFKFINVDLQEQYQEDFADFMEAILRHATLLLSITYKPSYITKVYRLKGINELLLYSPYII